VSYEGKYLLVWERRAGTWSIVVYSLSSNSSPAGTGAAQAGLLRS
jgi:hypothetical protein